MVKVKLSILPGSGHRVFQGWGCKDTEGGLEVKLIIVLGACCYSMK